MMKSLLKQVSCAVLCVALSAGTAWAFGVSDLLAVDPVYQMSKKELEKLSKKNNMKKGKWEDLIGFDDALKGGSSGGKGDFTNADSAVNATKFFSGKEEKDFKKISDWLSGKKFNPLIKDDSDAYKDVHKQISKLQGQGHEMVDKYKDNFQNMTNDAKSKVSGLKNQAGKYQKEFQDNMTSTTSMFDKSAVEAVKSQIGDDIKTKAKDIATLKEAKRLINEEVIDAMEAQSNKTSKVGEGLPTVDYANITAGMFNLDSVFGSYHANEGVRDEDARICSMMGVSGTGQGTSTGRECCEKWKLQMEGGATDDAKKEGPNKGNIKKREQKGELAGVPEDLKYCCSLAPEMCKTQAQKAADCLNNELSKGNSAENSWKTCDIDCNGQGYTDLVHNIGGQYDPATGKVSDYDKEEVDKMMKKCDEDRNRWAPSPTVLSATEMAPVVPTVARDYVKTGVKDGEEK